MPRKLKVYRTPIGFHDAYVAAPSQKAALEAWGTDTDLFARGVAEVVSDDDLTHEPLAHPGKVIKRLRGSAAEQLAALPPDKPRKSKPAVGAGEDKRSSKSKAGSRVVDRPKPKPRPSRAALDEAERQLHELVERQEAEEQALRERELALARERRDLERTHQRDRRAAVRMADKERQAHSDALARWIEEQS